MTETAKNISQALRDLGCILEGKYFFGLENGRLATTFVDPLPIYTKPLLLETIAGELVRNFSKRLLQDVEVIAAPSAHITPLAHAAARHFQYIGLSVPDVVYVTPRGDSYVLEKRFESLVQDRPVLLVEDVVFTGRPLMRAAKCITRAGGKIVGATAVIRYSDIEIKDVLMPVFPTLPEINTFVQNNHPEWGTWPIITDYGYPDKFPGYFGPKRTLLP